jgi:hypothetical protein
MIYTHVLMVNAPRVVSPLDSTLTTATRNLSLPPDVREALPVADVEPVEEMKEEDDEL